jgi:hypothetical protein
VKTIQVQLKEGSYCLHQLPSLNAAGISYEVNCNRLDVSSFVHLILESLGQLVLTVEEKIVRTIP